MNIMAKKTAHPVWKKTFCLLTLPIVLASFACNQETVIKGIPWVQFHAIDFTRPDYTGIDRQIDLDTGTAYRDFSRLWVGRIKFPVSGEVVFEAECNNGLRLTIDDQLIIDGWRGNGQRHGSIDAPKNEWLPFRLEFYQDGGEAYCRLYWQWPGHQRVLIPDSAFAHFSSDRTAIMQLAGQTAGDTIPRENHAIIYVPGKTPFVAAAGERTVNAIPGPHLFIDDFLIADQKGIIRRLCQPTRDPSLHNPLITGKEDSCFQPFFTVSRRPEDGRFRLWYGAYNPDKNMSRSRLAYMESADGLHWQRPPVFCSTPEVQFGSEVMDRGPGWAPPDNRYIYSYWFEGGTRLAVSADGLHFKPLVEGVVIPHNHDITNIWWDPLRQHYVATISTMMPSSRWLGSRRTTLQCYSDDLLNWTSPALVLYADPAGGDPGQTQFYAMSAYLVRGPLAIAMVKVLRDDLKASGVSKDAYGRAHTSLAWSRDGFHWIRDQAAFFEPDANPDAWDHAHAWIDEQLMVGDQLYLYYGGYKQGHKKNRFEERQIGLVRMSPDRYVARYAAGRDGYLKTIPIKIDTELVSLQLNADASKGEIRVALIDPQSAEALPGFSKEDCLPVHSDDRRIQMKWLKRKSLNEALLQTRDKKIQLAFYLKNAALYAFEFSDR
jgi:hypothetical protein